MPSAPSDSQAPARFQPGQTLADIFGPGVVYVPRRSLSAPGWAPVGPGVVDYQTGNQLTIAGRIPYVASASVLTPPALALLEEAGVPIEAQVHDYRSLGNSLDLLRRLSARGLKLALQRPFPAQEIAPDACLVPPRLQSELNDKGRMGDLVPAQWLPARRTIGVSRMPPASELLDGHCAVVLKVSTPLPSGGGYGVWICRSPADIELATAALAPECSVVIEEFLSLTRTVCIHAVVLADGTARLAGAAEEICGADGRWLGDWTDAEADRVPSEVSDAVLEVVRRAAARGYRGIAGIDVAFPNAGPPKILDLNFRVNGSTAMAWMRPGIESQRGPLSMRLRIWSCPKGFSPMIDTARRAVRRGTWIPFCLYDPAQSETAGYARMSGVLLGPTRDAVREEERRLIAEGLS